MRGDGGTLYWGRKEEEKANGIVVVFAWISSEEKEIDPYVQLYASIGWNSLVCHPQFHYLHSPEKATLQAFSVLDELLKEVKDRPLPIVFAAFSGGPKACMYKVLKIIEGLCEAQGSLDEYQPVRDCISGHIYDSSPVDITSDMGNQLALYPTIMKMPQLPRVVSWITKAIASGMDALFPNRLEAQRTEYWQTLCSSAYTGPCLIFCSEDDNLAPYQIIYNFAQRMLDLGGDVKLVKLSGSHHLGHYRQYPVNYKAAAAEFLEKATVIYFQRMQHFSRERSSAESSCDKISESDCNLYRAEVSSNQCLRRVVIDPNDRFSLPSSEEYDEIKDAGPVQDNQKEKSIHLQDQPSISAHSVLGQVLFDVCVPKNIEDWDIKPGGSLTRHTFGSSQRRTPFNPIKCIRRSRL
eukprot:TRINITY_DN14911_c0_g1_i3.p1 TRINITY_DN14911_c0_g1~~TRINITY_DN14911_c0_g1_i3.p1  ORF type:complete len:408 (+),score=56.46 TRINITY_DN14911_c0_g1_i3:291-1514(+)